MQGPSPKITSFGTVLLLTVGTVLVLTAPASAYLDPGSGSMLVQMLLGGVAGIAVALRVYWRRLASRFRPTKPKDGHPDSP
jgi:hypothetical protein